MQQRAWECSQPKPARKQGQRVGSKGPGTVSHQGECSTSGMDHRVLKSPARGETLHMCACTVLVGSHSSLGDGK